MKNQIFYLLIPLLFLSCDSDISNNFEKYRLSDEYLNLAKSSKIAYNDRIIYNKKAVQSIIQLENDSLNREHLLKAGWNFYRLNSWKNLKLIADLVYTRSVYKNNMNHIAHSNRLLGLYYENISLNDSAFYFYSKAQKLFTKLSDHQQICALLQDKSQVQYYINDYLGSDLSLISALKIAKANSFKKEEFAIYINLGINSHELNDFKTAEIYYNKACEIVEKNKFDNWEKDLIRCLNSIGYNYYKIGLFNKSIKYYLIALENPKISEDPFMHAKLLDNLALSKFKLKDYKNVLNFYLQAGKLREIYHYDLNRNYNKIYLSEYYTYFKDTVKAKKYAQEAYSLSVEFRAPTDMMLCLKQLSKADPKNALNYSQEYIKISDSMHQLERETRNKFAKITYETEEITQEKDTAVKESSMYFGGMVTVGVILSLLLIIKTQQSRHKNLIFAQSRQKTNEEIYHLIQSQQSMLDEGREIEKKRIARDLHDGIMNKLSSTRLNLHKLKSDSDKETIEKCIPYIDSIHEIEKEIRNIAHDLNTEVFLENDSFQKTLATLFEEQRKTSKSKIHIDIQNLINWEQIKSIKKVNIYRILQEALCNAEKYATAENIFVGISAHKDFILVEIHDDGIGFSVKDRQDGIGIKNIRSRAKDCGGLFHIDSKKETGTTIIVSIPISNS